MWPYSVGQNQELEIIQRLLKNMEVKCTGQSWESSGLQQLPEETTCLEPRFWIQSDSVWILVISLTIVWLWVSHNLFWPLIS